MTRERLIRKKEDVNKIRKYIHEVNNPTKNVPSIVDKSYGSIGEVKTKSLYFKLWVKGKHVGNSLIGSGNVQSAPEYSTDSVLVDQHVGEMTDDIQQNLEKGASAYDKDNIDTVDTTQLEDLGISPKLDLGKDKKFIDLSIIENTTKRLIGKTLEEVEENCKLQMKAFHDDPNYETDMNMANIISTYKNKLIATGQDKKLISNKKLPNKSK